MSRIGLWLSRRGQKAHLVESEIATRIVTRCGREMEVEAAGGPIGDYSLARCKQCVGKLA